MRVADSQSADQQSIIQEATSILQKKYRTGSNQEVKIKRAILLRYNITANNTGPLSAYASTKTKTGGQRNRGEICILISSF